MSRRREGSGEDGPFGQAVASHHLTAGIVLACLQRRRRKQKPNAVVRHKKAQKANSEINPTVV